MTTQIERAISLKNLHVKGSPLILFNDPEVHEELLGIKSQIKRVDKKINQLRSLQFLDSQSEEFKFGELACSLGINVQISQKIELLFLAHLLTTFEREKGSSNPFPPRTILYDRLYKKSKPLSLEKIKEIFSVSRSIFSEQSATFFVNIVEQTQNLSFFEKELLLKRIEPKYTSHEECDKVNTLLTVSNAFYSTQATLQIAREKQQLLLIKEFRMDKMAPIGLYYRAESSSGPFVPEIPKDEDEPVLVFTCVLAKELSKEQLAEEIQKASLEEVMLANASLCDQFANEDKLELLDEDARVEVLEYREKAKEFGSIPLSKDMQNLRFIAVMHVNPSKVGSEKIQ